MNERELLKRLVEAQNQWDAGLITETPYVGRVEAILVEARELLAQPERKPLTDMQIASLRDKYRITSYGPSSREWIQVVDFVRAIEQAHGIE